MRLGYHPRRSAFALAATVSFGACGAVTATDGTSANEDLDVAWPTTGPGARPDLPVDPSSVARSLPAVTVRDVTSNEWVQFANLLPATKPLLVWFWTPH